VTTLAGLGGQPGAADGQGAAARLNGPRALAVIRDAVEERDAVYVSDLNNHAVRRVSASGAVTTIVGRLGASGVAAGPLPGGLASPVALAALPSGSLAVGTQNAVLVASPENPESPWR
jgi:hypothetical protein